MCADLDGMHLDNDATFEVDLLDFPCTRYEIERVDEVRLSLFIVKTDVVQRLNWNMSRQLQLFVENSDNWRRRLRG